MAAQNELYTCHKPCTIFITTITFIVGIFTVFNLPTFKHYIIFGTIKGIISWKTSKLPLSFTMYASSLVCKANGLSEQSQQCHVRPPIFSVKKFCCSCHLLPSTPPLLLGQPVFSALWERVLILFWCFFRSSFCLHHSCIMFLVKCGRNCPSAILLPCCFAYIITFNCKTYST